MIDMINMSMDNCNIDIMIIVSGFRVLSKVFINIIDPILIEYNKHIQEYNNLSPEVIKKLKTCFSNYQQYKNEITKIFFIEYSCIDDLLDLKFRDFLELIDFPLNEKKCSTKFPKFPNFFKIILEENANEEKKIVYLKNKEIIFFDIKNSENKREKKESKNSKYCIPFDNENNKLFIEFLNLKCSEIINIIIAEDRQQSIENYLNRKRKPDSKNTTNGTHKSNYKTVTITVNNPDVLGRTNFNEENNKKNFYFKNKQTERFNENDLTNGSPQTTKLKTKNMNYNKYSMKKK